MNDPDKEYEFSVVVGTEKLLQKMNNNMSNFKEHLISLATTFVSSFLLVFCVAISSDGFTFSKASVIALSSSAAISAVRTVAKLIVAWFTTK